MSFIISFLITTSLYTIAKIMLGSSCNDGSHSSSIGLRGACSHHGGVNHHLWLFFLALVLFFIVFNVLDNYFTSKKQSQKKTFLKK